MELNDAGAVKRLSTGEEGAAEAIGVSVKTLQKKRNTGDGPPFTRFGRRVLYLWSDLEAYLLKNRVNSTSQK